MARALAGGVPGRRRACSEHADLALGEPISVSRSKAPRSSWIARRTPNRRSSPPRSPTSRRCASAGPEWGIDAPDPVYAAGHSMGQYSALVAAGALELADAVRLVRERGRLMQASGAGREGRMAAVIGLDDAQLPELIRRAGEHGVIGVANRNSPGQVVVSGERQAIEAALGIARELGAKRALELPVSVAAHSPLMAEAADGMREILARIRFRDPHPPLLANADARPITTADAARAELVDHLTTGVDWVGAVRRMRADGVATFIEVGPGTRPDRPHQAHRPRCRRPARRRPRGRRPPRRPVRGRRRLRLPHRAAGLTGGTEHQQRSSTLRKPDYDRRVVVTGLGVVSPVGNDKETAWSNLIRGNSGIGEITKFDTTPYEHKAAGEVKGFDATRVARPQGRPAQRAVAALRRRRGQAGRRRLRAGHRRSEPRRGRRRLRLGGRRSAADDRELLGPHEKGPNRVAPTFIANGLVDSTSGMIAIETGATATTSAW